MEVTNESVLFDLEKQRFWCYEQDHTEMHALFGGEDKSGELEIKGYNPLFRCHTYRPDINEVPKWREGANGVSIFVPVLPFQGVVTDSPIAVTDGLHVAYLDNPGDVLDTVTQWETHEWQEDSMSYFSFASSTPLTHKFYFYSPCGMPSIRAASFIKLPKDDITSLTVDGRKWSHERKGQWHWSTNGYGLYWCREGEKMHYRFEMKRTPDFCYKGCDPIVTFSGTTDIFDWHHAPVDVTCLALQKLCRDKEKKECKIQSLYRLRDDTEKKLIVEVITWMKEACNCNLTLTREQCESSSPDIDERYAFEEEVTLSSLAARPYISEMLEDRDFLKLIINAG